MSHIQPHESRPLPDDSGMRVNQVELPKLNGVLVVVTVPGEGVAAVFVPKPA